MILNRRAWWARNKRLLRSALRRRRLMNLVWNGLAYHWAYLTGRTTVAHRPVALTFEPTTHCNLRCPQCISGRRAFTRPTGQASSQTLQKVLDEIGDDIFYLSLYFQGEPYLNPHLWEMCRIARQYGVFTDISTNGHYFSEKCCHQTVEEGPDQLIISLDGTTPESYRIYRVGGQWQRVMEGIHRLMQVRCHYQRLRPYVILQFIVFAHNEQEVADVEDLARQLGVDELRIKTAQVYEEWEGARWIPSTDRYSRYEQSAHGLRLKSRRWRGCTRVWQEPTITWDGQILPCCFDKDADFAMGNIRHQSFDTIWNGKAYQMFRKQVFTDRTVLGMCRNCTEGTRLWVKK